MKKKVSLKRNRKPASLPDKAPSKALVAPPSPSPDRPVTTPRAPAPDSFTIVGIGASAGGLEAFEKFLANVTIPGAFAFILIQHLDPTREGALPALLQRVTAMKVVEAKNRTLVRPGNVYVIPPGRDISVRDDALYLTKPEERRGLRLPIDHFFRSLASDRKERSVGMIFSGMGSDGLLGAQAIKEEGGLLLVQDPATARSDSMPLSVIRAGLADIVAPVEKLFERLSTFLRVGPTAAEEGKGEARDENLKEHILEKIAGILKARSGHDFSQYKPGTLHRRIERRMRIHGLRGMEEYAGFLGKNPQESEILFKELLIGVTSFFRDPAVWEYLRKQILPRALAAAPSGHVFRAWVPGCSTGEEAYSLIMLFHETLRKMKPHRELGLQVFATDLDGDAIIRARQGAYPVNIEADVSADRLSGFFTRTDSGYLVNKEIRESVVFAPQNVIMDPPFTRIDFLSCRNLLIYLNAEVQNKLITLFHYSLRPDGFLILGNASSIGAHANLFTPVKPGLRIFRRKNFPKTFLAADFPHGIVAGRKADSKKIQAAPPDNLETLADRIVLEQYSPAAVLCSTEGDIVYIRGRTGKYLEPSSGKVNWNILAMAREGLRSELSRGIRKAARQKTAVEIPAARVKGDNRRRPVNITIRRIDHSETLKGFVLVVFRDAPELSKETVSARGPAPSGRRIAELERELAAVHDESQITREEMQASQEELKSTNEELQSTNEELQSTNEELTTSREELQSLNEELQTVNSELQGKLNELSLNESDMRNLLNSTNVASLFLDANLRVRRYTDQAVKVIRLIPSDIGRPMTDLVTELDYPSMAEDAKEVLATLVFSEKEIAARDGRRYVVRIMPYRTGDDRIDGIVITFLDITRFRVESGKRP